MKSTIKTDTKDRAPTATATYHSRHNRAMINGQGMQGSQAPPEERWPKVAQPAVPACCRWQLCTHRQQPLRHGHHSTSHFLGLGDHSS
jgi:hypothetical protein